MIDNEKISDHCSNNYIINRFNDTFSSSIVFPLKTKILKQFITAIHVYF